ncbi:hypothetical protein ADK70_38605 [Streptomyces rimosus subsp. pseudoverticillatus]|uniref:hypothetical protein n=1 Tax=Streptomyces rimosus TaxID=1927 RepID=UPI0006B2907E|nr:hypothetical protein [Streptomyces rimosus]KOT76385.1 hypothetical protein ADK70_38605 [Streptomyces rimosus subsp. pseudoverticillatus]
MLATIVDISHLRLVVHQRPVTSASTELIRSCSGNLDEVRGCLLHHFAPFGNYCEVGHDLHSVSTGGAETRLRSRPDGTSWHADLFHAGWLNPPYEAVPADYRRHVAVYVDREYELNEGRLHESDLREAAGEGGAPAVERLIRRHRDALDQQYAALDSLIDNLVAPDRRPFPWARELVYDEVLEHHTRREWLGSAAIAYLCGDSAGQRPETILGGICYDFRAGSVDLTQLASVEPEEGAA